MGEACSFYELLIFKVHYHPHLHIDLLIKTAMTEIVDVFSSRIIAVQVESITKELYGDEIIFLFY